MIIGIVVFIQIVVMCHVSSRPSETFSQICVGDLVNVDNVCVSEYYIVIYRDNIIHLLYAMYSLGMATHGVDREFVPAVIRMVNIETNTALVHFLYVDKKYVCLLTAMIWSRCIYNYYVVLV